MYMFLYMKIFIIGAVQALIQKPSKIRALRHEMENSLILNTGFVKTTFSNSVNMLIYLSLMISWRLS